jgi:hypothetical protein
MYAREICDFLHRELSPSDAYDDSLNRFERLRGHGLLPQGRQNQAVRLSDEQIASAILAYISVRPSFGGHVSYIMGDLRTVGGVSANVAGANTLLQTVVALLAREEVCRTLVSLTLTSEQNYGNDDYSATAVFNQARGRKVVSFVSHMAESLLHEGAEQTYDHQRLRRTSARQLVLGRTFFEKLGRDVAISRDLDLPFKLDWRAYDTAEERDAFHRKLGARPSSNFLNMGVDAHVTWPREPKRVEFSGHHLVLFPLTKEHSKSISIDLMHERLSMDEARTLIHRFLSVLAWCDDGSAVLKWGWAGNPIPVPVERSGGYSNTMVDWHLYRSVPKDQELLERLAYYREALNAQESELVTFAVLSFYKVFERREASRKGVPNPTHAWIETNLPIVSANLDAEIRDQFENDCRTQDMKATDYIVKKCRVATAHASANHRSDPDSLPELQRLHTAAEIVHALARHSIRIEYGLSESYFSD